MTTLISVNKAYMEDSDYVVVVPIIPSRVLMFSRDNLIYATGNSRCFWFLLHLPILVPNPFYEGGGK